MSANVRGILFPIDGPPRPVSLVHDDRGSLLTALYATVGCSLVERFALAPGVDLIMDEEGALVDGYVLARGWERDGELWQLAGNVVAVGVDEDKGEWVTPSVEGAKLALYDRLAWVADPALFGGPDLFKLARWLAHGEPFDPKEKP